MRPYLTPLILVFILAGPMAVQAQVSDDMTCEEAKSYFAENGMIQTQENGQVIPIDEGVPEAQRGELECENRGDVSMPVFVKTKDVEECAISYACEE